METDHQEQVALHRWAVIAEATSDRLSPAERGALVRQIAFSRPRGPRRVGSSLLTRNDRPLDTCLALRRPRCLEAHTTRRHRSGARTSGAGSVRPLPSASRSRAARLPRSPRSSITATASKSPSGPSAASCDGGAFHREALEAEPTVFGRYEADRPNERWITDVLVGPWVPFPRSTPRRAKLFLIVDDHSRLLVDGRFFAHENARACQELLRKAITRRGVPDVLYADTGRLSPTPGCHGPVLCSESASCTPSPIRQKAAASRNGSTATSGRPSCPRRPIRASPRSRS